MCIYLGLARILFEGDNFQVNSEIWYAIDSRYPHIPPTLTTFN